jgi:hypothetical protein
MLADTVPCFNSYTSIKFSVTLRSTGIPYNYPFFLEMADMIHVNF